MFLLHVLISMEIKVIGPDGASGGPGGKGSWNGNTFERSSAPGSVFGAPARVLELCAETQKGLAQKTSEAGS
ncbi:hypothetical protein TNCV_2951851 [Trichonephila clavipes]|nr:hypothetical protein TNCV_2951851 [Trichonephila clavipes]